MVNEGKLIKKIALGTVQFGLKYGIANKIGRPSKKEVFTILEFAYKHGINTLDTAYSYGKSEEIIGEFVLQSKKEFKIISKPPHLNNNAMELERYCLETLRRLNQNKIYGYLIHKFDNILTYENLWNELEFLKQKRLVGKIGVSLYKPEELDYLLNKKIYFDIVQVPYSIFDRRFENYFPILKKRGVEIYARSIFLQGLAFMKPDDLPRHLLKARDYLKILQSLVKEKAISISSLCLIFVLLNLYIDKVIIGIDSLEHLEKNIEDLNSMKKIRNIYEELNMLSINDEDIILPYKWGIT